MSTATATAADVSTTLHRPRLLDPSTSCPICGADIGREGLGCEHGTSFARCDHCDEVLPLDELAFEAELGWWVCVSCVDLCVDCGERSATTEDQHGNRICDTHECRVEQAERIDRARIARWVGEDDDIPFAESVSVRRSA